MGNEQSQGPKAAEKVKEAFVEGAAVGATNSAFSGDCGFTGAAVGALEDGTWAMKDHDACNMAGIVNTTDYGTNGPEWGKETGMYNTGFGMSNPQCEGCYGVKFGMGCDRGKVEWMKWRCCWCRWPNKPEKQCGMCKHQGGKSGTGRPQ